jgi:hypothetical protein
MEMRKAHDYDERRIRSNSLQSAENGISNCGVVLIFVGMVATWFPAMVAVIELFDQSETGPLEIISILAGQDITIRRVLFISRPEFFLLSATIYYSISMVLLGLVWVV